MMLGFQIKSKKAQLIGIGLAVIVLIVCGIALAKFITSKTGVADLFNSPANILGLNQEKEKFEFYVRESAKLAVVEAYQEIANAGSFACHDCTFDSGYINFDGLAEDFDGKFSFKIEAKINNFILSYPNADFSGIIYTASIKDKQINFKSEKKQLGGAAEGFFAYSFTYDFLPSFSLSLDDLNLNSFQEIFGKASECMKLGKSEDIEACMNELQFDSAIKKIESRIYFDLASKKRFFIGDSYKNIEIKFVL